MSTVHTGKRKSTFRPRAAELGIPQPPVWPARNAFGAAALAAGIVAGDELEALRRLFRVAGAPHAVKSQASSSASSCETHPKTKRLKIAQDESEVTGRGAPLSKDDITSFQAKGYVLLKNAFSRRVAEDVTDCIWKRMAQDGIERDDPNTWCERKGIAETYGPKLGPPWCNVFTDRLLGAFDQLMGKGMWEESSLGLGWWVVTFPGFGDGSIHDDKFAGEEDCGDNWSAAGRWHVDGAHFRHFLNSKEVGLLPIFLFSDIGPQDGGTLLCQGSHKVVAQVLSDSKEGLSGVELSRLAKD